MSETTQRECLYVLILEDVAVDAELMLLELEKLDSTIISTHVQRRDDFIEALRQRKPDIILADYFLPQFDGMAALALAQKMTPDVPLIVVTGSINEETAVECMKAGATDYLLKGSLLRLSGAVKSALEKKRINEEKKKSEAILDRLKKAIETIELGVTITDLEGRILYTNPAEAKMHGYTVDELLEEDARVLAPPEFWKPVPAESIKAMGSWRRESLNIRRDGTLLPVQLISEVITNSDGVLIGIITTCEDITERRAVADALRQSEERYMLAVRGAKDGLWDWNLRAGKFYFSPRWKSMLGYEDDEIGKDIEDWFRRVHPDDLSGLNEDFFAHVDGLTEHFENEHRVLHKDGKYRWVLSRGQAQWDDAGKATRISGSLTDITDRKVIEEELVHKALYDSLTLLPNRVLFLDRLGHCMRRAKRRGEYQFALMYLDLDGFKPINDNFGHPVGDQLLTLVARRIEECVRPGDTVARLGGDEFAILMDNIPDAMDVERAATRILERVHAPFNIEEHDILSSASIGIAFSSERYTTPDELIRDADAALYRAKAQGKSRYELFDNTISNRGALRSVFNRNAS